MRQLIMVTPGKVDPEKRKEKIQKVSDKLSRYLDFYPVESKSSKYSIMGPVSKIIGWAKNSKNTSEFIKGRVLRMHELNKISGYVSSEALQIMEEAVDELLEFRQGLSPIELSKTMEIIDYEVYFNRRKKNIERLEQIKTAFILYIKEKYKGNIDVLKSKWDLVINDWNDIKFPTEKGKYFQDGNDTQKEDITKFWNQHRDLKKQIIDEEEIDSI